MKLIPTKEYLLFVDREAKVRNNQRDYIYCFITKQIIKSHIVSWPSNEIDVTEAKIMAYYPLIEGIDDLDLPLLPPLLEDWYIASSEYNKEISKHYPIKEVAERMQGFMAGYKAAQSKQFSLEDMEKAILNACIGTANGQSPDKLTDSIIQSLSIQQLPKEFIPEYNYKHTSELLSSNEWEWIGTEKGTKSYRKLKTITNSEGKLELVGEYRYES